jgi:predicted nucleic acid-binding protein
MRSVSTRFFVDTNVIAYAYNAADDARRERAQVVLDTLRHGGNGAISTQVLGELYRAMTRPRGLALPHEVAEASVLNYLQSWLVYDVQPLNALEALRGVREHHMSYYDALIWATARLNGVPYVLSEDGQDGQYLEGVTILNPFLDGFKMDWLR